MRISQSKINDDLDRTKKYMKNFSAGFDYNQGRIDSAQNNGMIKNAKDLTDKFSSTAVSLFSKDNNTLEKGFALVNEIGSVFAQYAGADGSLDKDEYDEAINSSDYIALLDEYNSLKEELGFSFNEDDNENTNDKDDEANENSSTPHIGNILIEQDENMGDIAEKVGSELSDSDEFIKKDANEIYSGSEILNKKGILSDDNRASITGETRAIAGIFGVELNSLENEYKSIMKNTTDNLKVKKQKLKGVLQKIKDRTKSSEKDLEKFDAVKQNKTNKKDDEKDSLKEEDKFQNPFISQNM